MGLKLNVENSFFRRIETKYIVLWVSKDGVIPLVYKEETAKAVDAPTKLCNICKFIGLIIFHWDMWGKYTQALDPL